MTKPTSLNDHATDLPDVYIPPRHANGTPPTNGYPAVPPQQPWILRNVKVSIAIATALFTVFQWIGVHLLHDLQEPARKKAEAEIRKIHRDMRTLAVYQLEAGRHGDAVLESLATYHGITVTRPRELDDAETRAKKLRDK